MKRLNRNKNRRSGAILVWMALLTAVLLGMVSLVVDGGLLMSQRRQIQSAADAAAQSAAFELMRQQSDSRTKAIATAQDYVTRNFDGSHTTTVNIAPVSTAQFPTAYNGATGYVQVIVSAPINTFFVHFLDRTSSTTVSAMAVAGYESYSAGEGVCALDPSAIPGLKVSGGGALKVLGSILVNSQGGGIDENGVPVLTGGTGYAATGGNQPSPTTGVFASDMRIVGGVDKLAGFHNIDPANPAQIVHCNECPAPDPLLMMPTPTVALGVDTGHRGAVKVSNNGATVSPDPGYPSEEIHATETVNGVQRLVLFPGVYRSISITGGSVRFVPGIYVIQPIQNTTNTFTLTSGTVTAPGVLIYNTGNTYDPTTGAPDCNDNVTYANTAPTSPPLPDGTKYMGSVQFNGGASMSGIDITHISYPTAEHKNRSPTARAIDPALDGMLFYQRRANISPFTISGNAADGSLQGTLYCKWATVKITGQGTYNAQFIVGSMDVAGTGNVTVSYAGRLLGKAPSVYLVE